MKEEIYKEARKTWNGSGQEARKILVRWFALTKNLREMFCKIVCEDGNCPKDSKTNCI
jgi:hypothetical protein